MSLNHITHILEYSEIALAILALIALFKSKEFSSYKFLGAFLSMRVIAYFSQYVLLTFGASMFGEVKAYQVYFYTYWSMFAIESILMLVVICSMYRHAMAPLKGLHNLGMLIFYWVGAISVLVALGTSASPQSTGLSFTIALVSRMQRTQSILILCLLVFVCFAIRPMGLTFRSRVFGVSLGLGVMATTDMVQSSWLGHLSTMYGAFSIISSTAVCLTLLTWAIYFFVPEPKRRLIVLPTTSPFLRWNQISEVLGDDPGFVAIAGIPPDMLAPAELEVMARASAMMKASDDAKFNPLTNPTHLPVPQRTTENEPALIG